MAVILFLPWVMEHTKGRSDSLWFMTKAVLCTLPIAALVGSNNLSTAIILLGICAFLIFISHPGYLPFLGIGGAGIGFIAVFLMMESYRLERLAIWRNPEAYEKGFQTIQGLYAIGSGRIFGCGLGKGLQKLGFVPEAKFIVMLTVNVLLNTLWISMLYGKGIMVLLPARALKNLIMWPIDSIIFYSLTKLIEQTGVFRMFHARTAAQAQR